MARRLSTPASSSAKRKRLSDTLRRRRLLHQSLEKREMLAADYEAHAIFAEGTPMDVVDQWEAQQRVTDGLQDAILQGSRWRNSAIESSPNNGDPIRVTWSIVPDGTPITGPAGNGETSDLVAFLDGIYGGGGTSDIEQKPWFPIFTNIYDVWSENTGLDLVYEPADDGAAIGDNANIGVLDVRGDMRVGGRFIDGNSNVLGFNFYPNGSGNSGPDGDMIIDTADNFYVNNADGPTGENRGLTNVLAHEVGHGIGIAHALPVDSSKLMEPFVNFAFLGPQEDDIFNAQQLYGDALESNETLATATDLGVVKNSTRTIGGASIDNGSSDVDVYAFEVTSPTELNVLLRPTGTQYLVGPQTGGPSVLVNRLRQADLSFRLLAEDGTEILAVDDSGLGSAETLNEFTLDTPGKYFLQVEGVGAEPQLYDLTLRVGTILNLGNAETDLRLVSVNPNAEAIFSDTDPNLLDVSPSELTFRFSGDADLDESTLENGIRIRYAGEDQRLDSADDEFIEPGWVGFGLTDRTVITRFAEPLDDGRYRVEVFGVDIPEQGITAVRDTDGDPLVPRVSGSDSDNIDFELELGARVVGVVPQPVLRLPSGAIDPQLDVIHVYFDDNDLFAGGGTATLANPAFYQLVRTENTVSSGDDQVVNPIDVKIVEFETQTVPSSLGGGTVEVQVRVNRVELTFADDLSDITGSGAFRLKVGSDATLGQAGAPIAPTLFPLAGDPSDTTTGAPLIATLNGQTAVRLSSTIADTGLPFDYPGGNNDPGHRDIYEENHLGAGPDSAGGIQTIGYNFALDRSYGFNSAGRPVFTVANPEQLQRFREVFEYYGQLLGVEFVETVSSGITVVVGDMFPNGEVSGPGGVAGVAGPSLAILDSAEAWDNTTGGGFFSVALHEIGHSIGLGHTYEQPGGTIMGNATEYAGSSSEWVFPGDVDIVHGQYLYRPDNRDVDMFEIVQPAGQAGTLLLETFAERRDGGSLLNSQLVVYKRNPSGVLEMVGSNDDSYGDDSGLSLNLEAQDSDTSYFVAVTARGNEDFDPRHEGSGSGGDSQGDYDLLVRFNPRTGSTISDAAGTPIDGDGDGNPGGAFNFWFQAADAANTMYVDAAAAPGGNGSEAAPFREIDEALVAASAAANTVGNSQPVVVRIVANAGADGVVGLPNDNFEGNADNQAYVIGPGLNAGTFQKDGRNLIVPKDVTVMIDAGVVLKMLSSRIAVGSGIDGNDASGGALQVLGVPHLPVFITSYNDPTTGLEVNPLDDTPARGDWGGIEIRNDVDRGEGRRDFEREGIFLNYIAGADIQYGGGRVNVSGQNQAVAPIQMNSARPTLINNSIHQSTGPALSADPSSFEETNFTTLRYQRKDAFVPDYDRVGPLIYDNSIIDNSVNGLLVRIDTLAGGALEELTVPGRFDDTEVTHILGDNLLIKGNPVGHVLETQPAAPTTVTLDAVLPPSPGGAGLAAGTYDYVITYIDAFGYESIPTVATGAITITAGQAIELNGLPNAGDELYPAGEQKPGSEAPYVSRRLYRRDGADYHLVADLNRSDTSYTDELTTPLDVSPPTAGGLRLRSRPDGRLTIDPGVVIKSSGVRIETGFGADLIAEGVEGRPVVFTSRNDDRYGAGGSFDTNGDGDSQGTPGDWAGINTYPFSRLSVDHAVFAFAGGISSVGGTVAGFNAIEVHQAFARIANSQFEFINGGTDAFGSLGGTRAGRGPHDQSVLFVAGSQPVIANNMFTDMTTGTAAISINVNALNAEPLDDFGRQTGSAGLVDHAPGNYGPLVVGNRIEAGGLGGMRVRPEMLTTESVWDDTDIVHIVSGDIEVPDVHTYGGLRLESQPEQSLVVKLDNDAQLIAGGRPLDIDDRIGGIVQIVGSPGFPVILTSSRDDSVGAGFDPFGAPLRDTNGDGISAGVPGDWGGIEFREFTHDRNVEVITELEGALGAVGDLNSNTASAQALGLLAEGEKSSDENLRLGFSVYGTIASAGDTDVYSFRATAGTEVWIDVDRTAAGLDSVIEVINGAGDVIARSDNSAAEQAIGSLPFVRPGSLAWPMRQDPFAAVNMGANPGSYHDFYTTNPDDAGMRLVLPGATGTNSEFFVRITGADETDGLYQMQVRLQELDEFAGSTVRFADIRYADVGIQTLGLPGHSFLTGEAATVNQRVDLGNILNSDRAAITVSGELRDLRGSNNFSDINTISFSLVRDSIQSIQRDPSDNSTAGGNTYIATTIDVDFADGVSRPDTTLMLYYRGVDGNAPAQLVMIGTDSNIAADRSGPGEGSDIDDQTRGSVAQRDPFIGTVELLAGHYDLVVTNNARVPTDLNQYFQASSSNANVRLEPLTSVVRIAEDRFSDNSFVQSTASGPISVAFDVVKNADTGQSNTTPYGLGDVTMFVLGNGSGNTSRLYGNNALVGVPEAIFGNDFTRLAAIAMNPSTGFVYGIQGNNPTGADNDANVDGFYRLSDGSGGATAVGTTGIATFETFINTTPDPDVRQIRNPFGTAAGSGEGMVIEALAYRVSGGGDDTLRLYGVGSRGNNTQTFPQPDSYTGANSDPVGEHDAPARNYLYRLNPTTGAGISASSQGDRTGNRRASGAGTDVVELGRIAPDLPGFTPVPSEGPAVVTYQNFLGDVTGITAVDSYVDPDTFTTKGGGLYAVTDNGGLIRIDPSEIGDNSGDRNNDNPIGEFVTFVTDEFGAPIQFSSVTTGPRNVADEYDFAGERSNFPYEHTLFATDVSGRVYTLDVDGNLLGQLAFGQTSVDSLVGGGTTGIAFSNLDVNLWHQTDAQQANAEGHGAEVTPDNLRDERTIGDNSLYFGYDSDIVEGTEWRGQYSPSRSTNNYDFAGGAHGSVQSHPIDLRGYSSADEPHLYFNYLLQTDDAEAELFANAHARDSLRVYVSSENDPNWTLVSTNNGAGDNDYSEGFTEQVEDEFDLLHNGFFDETGTYQFTQELFDVNDWRQARVSLAPWAGDNDVRIRYEFDTAGEVSPYALELRAVTPDRMLDNDNLAFSLSDLAGTVYDFEFDYGLVIDAPTGAAISDGDTITLTGTPGVVTYTFRDLAGGPAAPGEIGFNLSDDGEAIAQAIATAVAADGFVVTFSNNLLSRIGIDATAFALTGGLTTDIIADEPGVPFGVTDIPVDVSMDTVAIRDALREGLARGINPTDPMELSGYQAFGETVRTFGLVVEDAGPLVAFGGEYTGVFLPGQFSGVYESQLFNENGFGNSTTDSLRQAGLRGVSNANNGVFIDDVIIGFAERGEMVMNANSGTSTTLNPQFQPQVFPGGEFNEETVAGQFQVEIRSSAEYGDVDFPDHFFVRDFNTNDWIGQAIALTFFDGSEISNRDRFQITDGVDVITFEFISTDAVGTAANVTPGRIEVPFSPNFSAAQIATSVRDAINSSSVQQRLDVSASSPEGETAVGIGNSATVLLHGMATSDLLGGTNFVLVKADGTADVQIPTTLYGTELAGMGQDDGDSNRRREQGQLILQGNRISFSGGFGIVADAGRRTVANAALAGTQGPHPGSPQAFPTTNPDNLVPGVVVTNNVLYGNQSGGIRISGDSANGPVAPQPFARVINNTVYGVSAGDSAILIDQNAAPTLVNNAVTNSNIGISVNGSPDLEILSTLYWNNKNNVTGTGLGSSAIVVPNGDAVFLDPTNGNLYPIADSQLIDSSLASVVERVDLQALKTSLGIAFSPILAPDTDITGQRRINDQTGGSGTGSNLFIDRGAIDRSDFDGPIATLLVPLDNDAAGRDIDSSETYVQLDSGNVSQFVIKLDESSGTGPDAATVTADSVILTENGQRLVPGSDYTFGYSSTSRTIVLVPTSGVWKPDAAYEITLYNRDRLAVQAPAGLQLIDGDQLTIVDNNDSVGVFEFESGYVATIQQSTLFSLSGPVSNFADGDSFEIFDPSGLISDVFELDTDGATTTGNIRIDISSATTVEDVRDAIFAALDTPTTRTRLTIAPLKVGTTGIQLGALTGSSVTEDVGGLTLLGTAGGVNDGDQISYTRGITTLVFEFKADGSTALPQANTDVVIPFSPLDDAEALAGRLADALRGQVLLGLDSARVIEGGRVHIGGRAGDLLQLLAGSPLSLEGAPGVTGKLTLAIPVAATGAGVDGQRFSVTVAGNTSSFQFLTDGSTATPDVKVVVSPTADAAEIAGAIAVALAGEFAELNSTSTLNIVNVGEDNALSGAVPNIVIDPLTSTLTVDGVPGGAIAIPFIPSIEFTENTVAGQIIAAIERSGLTTTSFAAGGGTILLDNTDSVDGLASTPISAIRDRAGNTLAPNRLNLETQFTILMPGVGLDFGDADLPYPTELANNGARHTLTTDRELRLGNEVDNERDGQPGNHDDDVDVINASYIDSDASNGALVSVSTLNSSRVQVSVTARPTVVDEGDILRLEVVGKFTLDFELVLAGNDPSVATNLPVLMIPEESAESFARRLSDVISTQLALAADTSLQPVHTEIRFDSAIPREFTILSVDDEDGVRVTDASDPVAGLFLDAAGNITGLLNPLDSLGTQVSISVTGNGLLDAWIDFNQDGDWNDPGEQILQNEAVIDGDNVFRITAPQSAIDGLTWARFRVSATGNLTPEGVAIGGEVEDHQVRVTRFALPTPIDDGSGDPAFTTDEDTPLLVGAADSILLNDTFSPDLLNQRAQLVDDVTSGTLVLNDDGTFEYTPDPDFNGTDRFTYRVVGDTSTPPPFEVGSDLVATVTLTVNAVNDAPTFVLANPTTPGNASLDVLEQDANATPLNLPFATNLLPGPATATDEAGQTVAFTVVADPGNPVGLLDGPLVVASNGRVIFTPAADAIGTAVFTITAFDSGSSTPPNVNTSAPVTLTVNVRPVNDPPVIDPAMTGVSDMQSSDDAYSVDAAGQITYTLREDNAQAVGSPAAPYVIDLVGTTGAGYNRIGLLDVFNAGPANEEDAVTPGGGQTIRLSSFDGVDTLTTALGGTVTADRDGSGNLLRLLYTPPLDVNSSFRGLDSFTYTVSDDGQTWQLGSPGMLVDDPLSATNTVFLDLQAVNDAPQFTPIRSTVTSLEDNPEIRVTYATGIFAGPPQTALDENDLVSGQQVEFRLVPQNAVLAAELFGTNQPTISTDGTLSYTSAPNAYGTVVFDVTLADLTPSDPTRGDVNLSAPTQLTITVQPQNDAPVFANTDPVTFTLDEDNSFLIPYTALPGDPQGLLDKFIVGPANEAANITPGGNQTLQLADPIAASTTSGGTLTQVVVDGRPFLRYRPKVHFNGTDTFAYSVVDNGQSVDLAGNVTADPKTAFFSVNLIVNPVNDPPQFGGATDVTALEDAGEDDPNVLPADVGLTVIPQWATNIQPGPAGAIDELATQSVTFTITPVDDALARTVFATDNNGNLQVTADSGGNLTFRTLPNANGVVAFTVVADDGSPEGSNLSTVKTFSITITPVNDDPTFTPGPSSISHDEDGGPYGAIWATDVLAGPADEVAAGQTVRFDVSIDAASAGLFQTPPAIADDGTLRFNPAADANGTATVTVQAIDNEGGMATPVTFEIVIEPVIDSPIANPDQFNVDEDTVRTLLQSELLANDVDPDLPDDTLTITLLSSITRSGASISLDANNNVIYEPQGSALLQALAEGSFATDSFSYTLTDSFGRTSEPTMVSLNVTGINDAPRLLPDNPDVEATGSTILRPLDNDFDVDGTLDLSTLEITLSPAFGAVTLPGDGTIVYTPYAGFNGTDTLRYTIKDDRGASGPDTLINIVANNAPIVVDDEAGIFRNGVADIPVLDNDSDPDLGGSVDAQSLVVVTQPSFGTAFVLRDNDGNLTGEIRYVPAEDYAGSDSFTYRVSDNLGRASETATVNVNISASRLQNPLLNLDVDGDGEISPIDALLNVNLLNRVGQLALNDAGAWDVDQAYTAGDTVQYDGGSWLAEMAIPAGEIPSENSLWTKAAKPFYDVDGNLLIEPFDVLTVVNELNRRARIGRDGSAGEAVPSIQPTSTSSDETLLFDQAHTTLATPAAKIVSTEVSYPVAATDDEDLLDTLARDKPAGEASEQEVVVDTLWRDFE
ncbi:tandem-95 repeat protein [Roseimaritima ulvae]|uniref:Matrixin n=1 Tax=Roseimaritima ulvae TaxID=980254 RepID=A0A5B9QIJ1_9BACT|nr:Ig-like domain-containing protein [Roseimaritima ulvae]QEG38917.1 Matrixin [Roseimaritima ulvae]